MYHEADPYLKWPLSANVSILLSVGGVFVHVKNEEIAKTLYYYLFVGKPIHWPVDSSYVQWWEKSFYVMTSSDMHNIRWQSVYGIKPYRFVVAIYIMHVYMKLENMKYGLFYAFTNIQHVY